MCDASPHMFSKRKSRSLRSEFFLICISNLRFDFANQGCPSFCGSLFAILQFCTKSSRPSPSSSPKSSLSQIRIALNYGSLFNFEWTQEVFGPSLTIYIRDENSSLLVYKTIRQPPTLPCRLQQSTIGRLSLNRRVRDGNGCYP